MTSSEPGAAPVGIEDTVVDLDQVVALLVGMGVETVVEQTGGGCATIHAGPTRPHPFEPCCLAHAAVAGPGRYGWGRRPSVAALDELVIGPDDCGETRPTDAALVGARDAAAVARLIADQATHPDRPATDAELVGAGFDPAPGQLREVLVPLRATTWALAEFTDTRRGPAGLCAHTLDRDLVLWTGEPGEGTHNPVASVVAAMFGQPGRITGPVVLTGWAPPAPDAPAGQVDHIGVAAVILLAGTAASCDLGDRTAERAAEMARLEVHIAAPPPADDDIPEHQDRDHDEGASGGAELMTPSATP